MSCERGTWPIEMDFFGSLASLISLALRLQRVNIILVTSISCCSDNSESQWNSFWQLGQCGFWSCYFRPWQHFMIVCTLTCRRLYVTKPSPGAILGLRRWNHTFRTTYCPA